MARLPRRDDALTGAVEAERGRRACVGASLSWLAACTIVAFFAGGCAATTPTLPVQPDPVSAPPLDAPAASLKLSRLDQLWQSRRGNGSLADFPIGTGDVITVSVPGLPESENSATAGAATLSAATEGTAAAEGAEQVTPGGWTVRVNAVGDIILPLLGRMHVAGLSEEQLRALLLQRLGKYMYDPQVEVFVRSYNSRQVAISGEVHAPGMYTINKPNETIGDLLVRAGGTTDNAGQRIILTPQPSKGRGTQADAITHTDDTGEEAGVEPASLTADDLRVSASYVIDLSKGRSGERYLNIPVRPGDTIYVPRAGTATVIGWVYSPKTIDVTPGLTVLSAVSQAGGTLFAADASHIKVLRQGAGHETKTLVVNLNDIKAARAPDVPVRANDVIDVPYSPTRIPGYALYYAMQGVLSFAPAALIVSGIP